MGKLEEALLPIYNIDINDVEDTQYKDAEEKA